MLYALVFIFVTAVTAAFWLSLLFIVFNFVLILGPQSWLHLKGELAESHSAIIMSN